MKKVVKILGFIIGGFALIAIIFASYIHFSGIPDYENKAPELSISVDSTQLAEGGRIAHLLCKDCHYDPSTDRLSGAMMMEDGQFGTIWAPNITKDPVHGIGRYTDGELAYLIRTGIKKDGGYAPPWMPKLPHLSDEDLHAVIAFFRSDDPLIDPVAKSVPESDPNFLAKFLCNMVFKPFDYPEQEIKAPPTSDVVAYGKYVATAKFDCYTCHSGNFETVDMLVPENSGGYFGGGNVLETSDKQPILSTNLTMDPKTGIGNWTEEQFALAVRSGIVPEGPALTDAMPRFTTLTDAEIHSIFEYLKTVPVIENQVDRSHRN